MSNGLGENALQEIFDLTLTTWSIALYIMWPMYLQSLKLLWPTVKKMHLQENTLFDLWLWPQGLGGQGYMKCCPLPSISCDLCTGKVWICYIPLLRRCIYKKIHYLILTLGSRSQECCPVPSILCDLCAYKVWICYIKRFRRICIYKKIHYFTFDLDVKITHNVAQYPLHHVTYSATKFEVATSNGLGGDTFTRNVTDRLLDGRRTDFETKLIYPFSK